MDRVQLSQELFEHATQFAKSHGTRFKPNARKHLKEKAEKAADDILAMKPAEQSAKIDEARRAFETFVLIMIAGADAIPHYRAARKDALGEQTFAFALGKLCPIWPFCP
jgi:hypothetical protein